MLIYESYANNANCEYWQLVDWYIIRIFASWFLNHFNQYKPNYSKLKSVSQKGLTSLVNLMSTFFERQVLKIVKKFPEVRFQLINYCFLSLNFYFN